MTSRTQDTREEAVRLFETFTARGHRRETEMPFSWPAKVQRVGVAVAELYRSNKWKSDLADYEDYKHIAESPHICYVVPGFLRQKDSPSTSLKTHGATVSVSRIIGSPAPQHFAVLAPLLGIQLHLQDAQGNLLPEEKGLYEITVAHAHLGAARPVRGRGAFLFVYTKAGIHMIIAGKQLDVLADGITG